MESHEVLREALRKTSAKAVAADLGVSLSLVYKWAEMPAADGSGSRNPLDRLLQIIELSGDTEILEWLCHKHGGAFVPDPEVEQRHPEHVFEATQDIIGQFSSMLRGISDAVEDHSITPKESQDIRKLWDRLKSRAESFVRACEAGRFHSIQSPGKS